MSDGPLKPVPGNVWRLASMGVELAGAVAGGCLLGYWIDWHFGTGRWGLMIGASLGIIGGLYNMIRKAVLESLTMSRRKPPPSPRGPVDEGDFRGDQPPKVGSP